MTERETPEGWLARGFHDIPDDKKLKTMSFVEVVVALAAAEKDSALFFALDREHKKRLTRDAAHINLRNVFIGGLLAGCFGLLGVVLGWYLRESKAGQNEAPASAVQQVQEGNLAVQPKVTNVPVIPPVASQPVAVPSPIKPNAQAGQPVRP
jgi:hypothetical protein